MTFDFLSNDNNKGNANNNNLKQILKTLLFVEETSKLFFDCFWIENEFRQSKAKWKIINNRKLLSNFFVFLKRILIWFLLVEKLFPASKNIYFSLVFFCLFGSSHIFYFVFCVCVLPENLGQCENEVIRIQLHRCCSIFHRRGKLHFLLFPLNQKRAPNVLCHSRCFWHFEHTLSQYKTKGNEKPSCFTYNSSCFLPKIFYIFFDCLFETFDFDRNTISAEKILLFFHAFGLVAHIFHILNGSHLFVCRPEKKKEKHCLRTCLGIALNSQCHRQVINKEEKLNSFSVFIWCRCCCRCKRLRCPCQWNEVFVDKFALFHYSLTFVSINVHNIFHSFHFH